MCIGWMEKIIVKTKYSSNVTETLAEKMGQLKCTKKCYFCLKKWKIFELGQIRHVPPLEKIKLQMSHFFRNCFSYILQNYQRISDPVGHKYLGNFCRSVEIDISGVWVFYYLPDIFSIPSLICELETEKKLSLTTQKSKLLEIVEGRSRQVPHHPDDLSKRLRTQINPYIVQKLKMESNWSKMGSKNEKSQMSETFNSTFWHYKWNFG